MAGANNLGILRAGDVSERVPHGTVRILSYGDSIGSGYGIDPGAMYSVVLERALSERSGRPFEVLAMSRGHSPTQYAFHVRVDVPRLSPHAVILEIELSNDVSDEARVRVRGTDEDGLPAELLRHRYLLGWDDQLLAPTAIGAGWIERTKVYYTISRYLGRQMRKVRLPPAFADDSDTFYYSLKTDRYLLTDAALERGFERLFESVAGIHAYLARRGVEFLLIVLPSQYAVLDGHRYQPGAMRLLRRATARVEELGIPAVSLTEAFDGAGGAELFLDFCHPTARGNRVIADRLVPELVALGE